MVNMNRTIPLLRFQCKTDPMKKIVIELHYQEGGMSFLAGEVRRRGYTIMVSPETYSTSESGVVWRSFTAYQGTLDFICEAKRYSEKFMNQLAKDVLSSRTWKRAFDYVMQKNSLTLEDYEQEV